MTMYQVDGQTVTAEEFIQILMEKVGELGQLVVALEQSNDDRDKRTALAIRKIFE